MSGDAGVSNGTAERWIRLAAAIAAPVTLLSALLFYFGYVSTRATYEYFGVDVDTVGLGTQEFIMRSPRPLVVPLIGLLLLGTLAVWAHAWVRARLAQTSAATAAEAAAGSAPATARIRRVAHAGMAVGGALLGISGALVVLYPRLPGREVYDLVIPVLIAAGAGLLAYGWQVTRLAEPPGSTAAAEPAARTARVMASVLLVAVIIGGLFWATAVFAQWSGRGEAVDLRGRLDELPSVILDTKERLYVLNPAIRESSLPVVDGQEFRYRYERLRLLVHGENRLFLVPAEWSAGGTTLVVPFGDEIRVQFQFQNPG